MPNRHFFLQHLIYILNPGFAVKSGNKLNETVFQIFKHLLKFCSYWLFNQC